MARLQRPHTATVRLTDAQHELLRMKVASTPGLSLQKVLSVAVNAFVRGDLVIRADGSYTIAEPSAIAFTDDAEAVDLDDLEGEASPASPETWGTRDLAAHAERATGRRVSLQLLRQLLREEFPKPEGAGHATRYRWMAGDAQIEQIVQRIREGALDEIRERKIVGYTS
jgi:hypothetical protein